MSEPTIRHVGELASPEAIENAYECMNVTDPAVLQRWCDEEADFELLRADDTGIVVRTEHAILAWGGRFAPAGGRAAFDVIEWSATHDRPWAVCGTLVQSGAPTIVLPRLVSDGSIPDPEAVRALVAECGHLDPERQYVVIDRRPKVIDHSGIGWTTIADHPRKRSAERPLLLIDVDGCLSPYNHRDERLAGFTDLHMLSHMQVHLPRARRLFALADRYDLAWATTWNEGANGVAHRLGLASLPVVPLDVTRALEDAPFENPKTSAILAYVGDRPFAWLDDWNTLGDATRLHAEHDCLIIRTAPRRGIEDHQLDALEGWATRP